MFGAVKLSSVAKHLDLNCLNKGVHDSTVHIEPVESTIFQFYSFTSAWCIQYLFVSIQKVIDPNGRNFPLVAEKVGVVVMGGSRLSGNSVHSTSQKRFILP